MSTRCHRPNRDGLTLADAFGPVSVLCGIRLAERLHQSRELATQFRAELFGIGLTR
jgi:hypothetical protein